MSYLELAAIGKNDWWRYLLSLLLIAFFWQILGAIPIGALMIMVTSDADPTTDFNPSTLQFEGINPIFGYLALNFSFLALLVGLWIAVRFIHKRSFTSLITPNLIPHWQRILVGFGVYFALMLVMTGLGVLLEPENYTFTFDASQFLLFLPLALILTPMQAGAEELLFRGYLLQGIGRLTANRRLAAVVSAILFMLPHLLNPEAKLDPIIMPLTYFVLGLFLAIITLKDNSLELAIGAHSANNLFTFLFSNYEGSVVSSPSVLTETSMDPLSSLISVVILASLFYVIVFHMLPRWWPATTETA